MQHLSEISGQALLGKEWLVKANAANSTPYLFKFFSSTIDLTCCAFFTDTKSVWAEELTSQQLARRWRECNPHSPPPFPNIDEEDEWRISILELLSKAHTIGGVNDLSFEVATSHYADIAFSLESDTFKWQWEACFLGHKMSSDIISKHLIYPLISTNHLLFTSPTMHDMTDSDVEKAVDKIGRTARRAVDNHVKNALAKPRLSTILCRMTAIFNSLPTLPSIISVTEPPDLQVPLSTPAKSTSAKEDTFRKRRNISVDVEMRDSTKPSPTRDKVAPSKQPVQGDSTTETEAEDNPSGPPSSKPHSRASPGGRKPTSVRPSPGAAPQKRSISPFSSARAVPVTSTSAPPESPEPQGLNKTSEDDSSPLRPPPKKVRQSQGNASDSDSESERRARIAQLRSGTGASATRGTRQPIRRGAKRF